MSGIFDHVFKSIAIKLLLLTIIITATVQSQSLSQYSKIIGITDKGDSNSTLVEINKFSGLASLIAEADTSGQFSIAISSEGKMVFAEKGSGSIFLIDSLNGGFIVDSLSPIENLSSIAFNYNDVLYGFDTDGNLFNINLENDTSRIVVATGENFSGFTFDPYYGELYASIDSSSIDNDAIVKVDTLTGGITIIGNTEIEGYNLDITFDQEGNLYGLKIDEMRQTHLFTIDKQTAYSEFVGDSTGIQGITSITSQYVPIIQEQTQIIVIPPILNYGDVNLGTYVDKIVRVYNPSDVNLNVSSMDITGADSEEFTLVYGNNPFIVYRNSYRDVLVRFTPADLDSANATIEVLSDDPDEGLIYVPLAGNAIIPPEPDIVAIPAAHDFGEVIIGKVKGVTIDLINVGNANLEITSMGIGGPNYSEFFFSPIDPSTPQELSLSFPYILEPGDTHSVDIITIPKTKGEINGILTVRSNDPDENPLDIPLQAVGLGIPDISVTPKEFYFGNVDPGTSKDQYFTIYNEGEEELIISATNLTGFHASEFSIVSGGAPITISPKRTSIISIRFEPETINERYADLVFESNDPDENPYIVELSGNRGLEPPVLKIVQPYYEVPLSMYVEWIDVVGVQEYQYRRKVDNGSYSDWISNGNVNFFLDNDISAGPQYTYQVRLKMDDDFSFSSKPRSSRAIKVWPAKADSLITSPDSREILNGFNTALSATERNGNVKKYLHEGLDIQGEGNVNDELIVAPVGGVITRFEKTNAGSDIYFNMRIRINNEVRNIQFNHLRFRSLSPELTEGWSIAPGEPIGRIASGFFGTATNNHTHFHYWDNNMMSDARNPLLLFDQNINRDPYLSAPVVGNINNNPGAINFTRGRNSNVYFPDNKIIYTSADIVAEITDHQSKDIPWVTPQRVGYYIKRHKDGALIDAVRNSVEPYILIDGSNWYGNSSVRPFIIFDFENAVTASSPNPVPAGGWPLWYTYKVTNTSGVDGSLATLDAYQCWATNAKNTEVSENGYRSGYSAAFVNEEALFPDGKYSIFIRAADFVNTAADYSHEVIVDNFRPYVKKCLVESAGSTIYFAKWDWDGSYLSLDPEKPKDGISGSAKVDRNVKIVITTSEPMKDLYIENIIPLNCGRPVLDVVNDDRTIWQFTIEEDKIPDDGSKNGTNFIHIKGEDLAGNPLHGYSESVTRHYRNDILRRRENGSWEGKIYGGADRMHRFVIGNVDVAFVIDDTGSMGEEIAGVRQALLNHLATYEDDGKTTFLLVTFKDDVSVGEPTSELSVIQSQVAALGASGGGDCPEGSVEAINAIEELMNDNGRVFLATDAAPHPGVDNSATIAALAARGVRVDIILSGDCDDLEKLLAQSEGSADPTINQSYKADKHVIKDRAYLSSILNDTLNLRDEDYRGIKLPFKFPFSDKEYDSVFVGSNGYITLGTGLSTNYAYYLTLFAGPPFLAGYFTDLDPQDGGKISYGLVEEDFYITFDTVNYAWSDEKVTFSIILRPDGTFAYSYGEIERLSGIVGFSVGNNVLDPGETDLSEASQPIVPFDYGSIYQEFNNNVDLSNTTLEFERVTYVKPPVLNAVSAFSLMAEETGGVFAYVPEVNSYNDQDKERFENIIFNLVQGAITQSLVLVEPKTVPLGSNLTISITGSGTNFQNTTILNISGSGIVVNRVNAVSAIRLEADIYVDEETELGFKDLIAITPLSGGVIDTAVGIGALEVIEQPYWPSIVGVSPGSGKPGQTLSVLIYGVKTNFADSSEVDMGTGIDVNSVKRITSTLLQAEITIASNAEVGFRDIVVNTGYERAREDLTGPFFVSMTSFEKPELISINPSYAAPGATLTLNIKGQNTHFKSGASVVTFSGTGIKLMNIDVIDTLQLNATIEVDNDAEPGFRDVRVSTESESAVFLSGLLITTNKPVAKFTSALFQNPAATKYCNVIVVTEELLESLPDVKMYSGSDTTNIIMSLMEGTDDVYKGSYMFNHSGEHWLRTEIHTSAGIDSVHLRNLEVLLAKTGNDNIIFSPNRDAALQIPKGSIEKDICFTAEQQMIEDSKVFHFGPELEFRSELTLEIDIDRTRFPMLEKLFIYKNVGNEWLRLPSKVYPLNNKIKTNITDLGHFKIMVDSTFSGNNIIPSTYALMQCYPNPFNPSTTIEFNLPEDNFIDLSIYNAIGQKIYTLASGAKSAGQHKVTWFADGIASGIYFYRLRTMKPSGINGKNYTETRKMILLR